MEVIPVVNCLTKECAATRLKTVFELGAKWVHLDIADGKFTPVVTWNKPEEFFPLLEGKQIFVEVHLMVHDCLGEAQRWLSAGAKRIIVPIDMITDFEPLLDECAKHEAEFMCAMKPDFAIERAIPFFLKYSISLIQVLAVPPGPAGQVFNEDAIQMISLLRTKLPNVVIEVDGGITPDVAKRVKEKGAQIITSASFIFDHDHPLQAYELLRNA